MMYDGRFCAALANEARKVLEHYYPTGAISLLIDANTKIIPLGDRTPYAEASPALRRLGVNVDGWPVPPAGLFVVEERSVYLRSMSAMTICHEAAHALDAALGGGTYLSGQDARIRRAFAEARLFVTPYAASGLDEYFAECTRAFVAANDPLSLWPAVSPERLRKLDPAMYAIIEGIFADLEARSRDRSGEQLGMGLAS